MTMLAYIAAGLAVLCSVVAVVDAIRTGRRLRKKALERLR